MPSTIQQLYPSHQEYVDKVARSANELQRHRFLLREDAAKVKLAAETSPVGCGLGFELVWILPPILWLRRRVTRRLRGRG